MISLGILPQSVPGTTDYTNKDEETPMLNRLFRTFAVGFALICALDARAADDSTQEFKLDNGMKIIVREDHRAPVIVSQVWYLVGSMDEFNGTTGVAHVLEHMMFKGTKDVPAGQFSKTIASNAGKDNAFTDRKSVV